MGGLMPDSTRNVTFSGADGNFRAAMYCLAARQRAVAKNVANVDAPNFKASEVRFEDALKSAMGRNPRGASIDQSALNSAATRTTVDLSMTTRADGNNVDID